MSLLEVRDRTPVTVGGERMDSEEKAGRETEDILRMLRGN